MSAARERANERLRSIDAVVFNLRGQKFNLQPSDPSVSLLDSAAKFSVGICLLGGLVMNTDPGRDGRTAARLSVRDDNEQVHPTASQESSNRLTTVDGENELWQLVKNHFQNWNILCVVAVCYCH